MPATSYRRKGAMRVAVVLALVVWSSYACAGGASGDRQLARVRVISGDLIVLDVSEQDFNNPDNCGSASLTVINQAEPGADRKLTLALAAFMAGKRVGMWFDGCSSTPWGYTAPHASTLYLTH